MDGMDDPDFPQLSMSMFANSGEYWKTYCDKLFDKIDVLEKQKAELHAKLTELHNSHDYLFSAKSDEVSDLLARCRPARPVA